MYTIMCMILNKINNYQLSKICEVLSLCTVFCHYARSFPRSTAGHIQYADDVIRDVYLQLNNYLSSLSRKYIYYCGRREIRLTFNCML